MKRLIFFSAFLWKLLYVMEICYSRNLLQCSLYFRKTLYFAKQVWWGTSLYSEHLLIFIFYIPLLPLVNFAKLLQKKLKFLGYLTTALWHRYTWGFKELFAHKHGKRASKDNTESPVIQVTFICITCSAISKISALEVLKDPKNSFGYF